MKTSINSKKVPRLFTIVDKYYKWEKNTVNLDYGGGKYDTATEFLDKKGVVNLILDHHNRSNEHNVYILNYLLKNNTDTVTLSNVLNIIKEKDERKKILDFSMVMLKSDGICYIKIYNSGKKGMSRKDCWQNAESLQYYLPEVEQFFDNIIIKHGIIIAKN